jgi:hypothetical protein
MTVDALIWALLALAALNLVLLAGLWLRSRRGDGGAHERRHAETLAQMERLERELRDELGRQAQASRADLAGFQQTLLAQGAEAARTQNEQLGHLSLRNEQRLGEVRAAVQEQLKALQEHERLENVARAKAAAEKEIARLESERGKLTPEQRGHIRKASPHGCRLCGGTGYLGRVAIFELASGPTVRKAVAAGTDAATLRKAAIQDGMTPLVEAGKALVLEGVTSIDEIQRVFAAAQPQQPPPAPNAARGAAKK